MTTYNGRSASYVAGKEVVNKEPPVSKYVVEKLYRVHRERLARVEPTIDSHVKIPEFLLNQTWKKNAERQKMIEVMRANRAIYDRLARVENEESSLAKENKLHIKRIESKLSYLNKLKEHGRLVNLVKIQKENEYLLRRIERAKPQYTLKKCKEWYKYHAHYKNGRRTDPTGGHIMHGMKELMPPPLPPLSSSMSSSSNRTDSLESLINKSRKVLPSIASGSAGGARGGSSSVGGASSLRSSSSTSYMIPPSNATVLAGKARPKKVKQGTLAGFYDHKTDEGEYEEWGEEGEEEDGDRSAEYDDVGLDRIEEETPEEAVSAPPTRYMSSRAMAEEAASDDDRSVGSYNDPPGTGDGDSQQSQPMASAGNEDLMLLASRPFAIPFDSKNCLVQVYSSRSYDENIYLKVVTSGMSTKVLAERALSIDRAYEIVNAGGHSSQIVHSTDNEDLASLSTLLINMFKEADDDGSGSLTFDEFQLLMEQVELGISPQELRFVISEADENENGVVDYDEFVPLAVDLIQSFRARNRAKALNSQHDVMIDDQIMKSISQEELEAANAACLEKIFEFDSKRYGLIRIQDMKRCLHSVTAAKVSEGEINMLCQMLPRDQFGRIKYNTTPTAFFETLSKVRFMAMKNALIEAQGSGLQKYLLDLCREEEARLEHYEGHMDKYVPTGIVPCRSLINILSNSSRLSLSRLQVLVIMSEASVLDGMINYFQFIPVVAKAIEIMFEPKALRQRAELIEKTDLSPEALLQCVNTPEVFSQRLSTLFKSYDIDHNGKLDQNEFIACLESLDFRLTYDEMVNLMNNSADTQHRGYLEFYDFMAFFQHNLLHLEREKRIRLLQNSMHPSHGSGSGKFHNGEGGDNKSHMGDKDGDGHGHEQSLLDKLLSIFKLSDPNNTGMISYSEFQDIMHNFSVHSSNFLMDVLLSELRVNENGVVDYMKSLSTCADLLKVFQAKESAVVQHKERERWAEEKAMHVLQASASDLNQIVRYIRHKLKKISEKNLDVMSRFLEVQDSIRAPSSGLNRTEANMVVSKLFYGAARESTPSTSPPKHISDGSYVWGQKTEGGVAQSPVHHTGTPTRHAMQQLNIKSSQQFRETLKSMNFQFSSEELFEAVFEARKVTIMRTLLHDMDRTSTQKLITQLLEKELQDKQQKNEIAQDSNFLPVKSCFAILEGCEELRLNRAQVMFIVSWAECFDRDGLSLEIYRFAEHAASIIEQLHVPEVLETRANVITTSMLDDKKVLCGLKEKDLVHYMESGCKKYANADGIVPFSSIKEILKDLPRLKLSEREVSTIVAGLPHPGEGGDGEEQGIATQDLVMPCVSLVRSLCRERTIHRRVSLIVTSSAVGDGSSVASGLGADIMNASTKKMQEEGLQQLKQLGEKLLNYIKIAMQGETITLALPTDVMQRRSSTLIEDTYNTAHHTITQLFRGGKMMAMHTIHSVLHSDVQHSIQAAASRDSMYGGRDGRESAKKHSSKDFTPPSVHSSHPHGHAPKPLLQFEVKKSLVPVFLQILHVEDTRTYTGGTMVCNVTFMDGKCMCIDNLPIRLNSAGMVDEEAAIQFVSNLVDNLYLEGREGENIDSWVVKIKEN